MKELSIISKSNNWNYGHFSRHLFKNLFLGTTIVAFLSNTFPVYAKNFDVQVLQVIEKATKVYFQGKDNQNSFNISNSSKAGYLTALNATLAAKMNTSSDYANFLITLLSEKRKTAANVFGKSSNSLMNARAFASARAGSNSVALGLGANAEGKESVAIGKSAEAKRYRSTVIGSYAKASVKDSIALGTSSIADVNGGIAGYDP
ncbi:hypothetical protein ME7_01186, partial [Bartonella birtlesii LL-WM9]